MSDQVVLLFAERLREYVLDTSTQAFSVIFHGGEPLLYTANRIVRAAQVIRSRVPDVCELEFSLQTNGVLLTEQALACLSEGKISVSLSLDGPRHVHDRHRLDHGQRSTFDATMRALDLLRASDSDIFRGVIAVIDPAVPPRELFEFFAPMDLPRLDFLLPDANHITPPPGSTDDSSLYMRWLEESFSLWFNEYPTLPVRWFDALLSSRVGVPSPTDAMGFGAVNLIVIETDGSYTDHDVFKVASERGGRLEAGLDGASFEEISRHRMILEHGWRLTLDGIATECRSCPVVEACGGGAVMHRAHPDRGLEAPTVYCGEMFSLLKLATRFIRDSLAVSSPLDVSEDPFPFEGPELVRQCEVWRRETEAAADRIASALGLARTGSSAASILLPAAYGLVSNGRASTDEMDNAGYWLNAITLQTSDVRLTTPFSDTVRVLPVESTGVQHALNSLSEIETCLRAYDPHLLPAMSALLSDIVFVESIAPDEGGIFSFSDDKAPNVLYIAPLAGGKPIPPEDLADSIYHEFLHQILYHYERGGALLHDRVYPRFPAPWRSGLRPSGGFLHGAFVFAGLARFWGALEVSALINVAADKATRNANRTRVQALYGLKSLHGFALLTPRGERLVQDIAARLGVQDLSMSAPGVLN